MPSLDNEYTQFLRFLHINKDTIAEIQIVDFTEEAEKALKDKFMNRFATVFTLTTAILFIVAKISRQAN